MAGEYETFGKVAGGEPPPTVQVADAEYGESVDAPPLPADVALPAPFGWTDGLTDTDGPRLWERVLANEQARNARHRRTATIVLIEVAGMHGASERWGSGLAMQLFVQLSRALARRIRKSDTIARIGPARFGVLLTETDEISAINFVDNIKDRCCGKFDPEANGLHLLVGWASPEVGGRLADALHVAETRLAEAIRADA